MKCVIPGANVKIIAKAVHALAKIGDEMYVQPQPNSLSFRALNMANSAYANFTFFEEYFSYYEYGDLEEDDALKCKISMRSAMTVFKMPNTIDKQVETCHIELRPNADVLFITLNYKNSIIKKHILPIIDCEKLEATYVTDDAANQLSSKPVVLSDAILNFQQNLIELTLEILPQKVLLRNYIDDTSNIANVTRTQLVLGKAEFDRYSVTAETTITFCLKELKAILPFAEFIKVPITIYFESAGRPVVFVLKHPTFEANLLLSTLNPDMDSQSEVTVNNKTIKHTQKKRMARGPKKRSVNTSSTAKNISSSSKTVKDSSRRLLEESFKKKIVNTNDVSSNTHTSSSENRVTCNIFSNVLKRKSNEDHTKDLNDATTNDNDLENDVPRSPSPPTKKARLIFKKCFQTTFDPRMLPGHDTILAEDSDEDKSE
ncbi:hypothetical protein KPH14_002166 [Odynerus spinipes]|uniref:Cell cycle checkpoint control protein n=1 Tax=Odynerus spinipes TaxID=1348599 RepID=A0AAD9RL09_9HYME|nr:hypothetical protein KPH14_002166 [Odynerus spinipes]